MNFNTNILNNNLVLPSLPKQQQNNLQLYYPNKAKSICVSYSGEVSIHTRLVAVKKCQ